MLVRKGKDLYVLDAAAKAPPTLNSPRRRASRRLDVPVDPREEWRQMFIEAWRLERDYFYDRGMHGVDWKAMRDKYRPLVDASPTAPS